MMRFLLIALVLAGAAVSARADDANFDFHQKKYDERWFTYNGRGSGDCIEPAEDGLRIHIDGKVPPEPVGIVWNCRVRGDFVVTARYAILTADPTPLGSGIEIYLMLANPSEDGIPVLRVVRSDEGPIFNCMIRAYDENRKRISKDFRQEKATADSGRGRIRVERKGTDFFASLAEGDSDDFKTVLKMENIDGADVKMIRFAGLSRGAPKAQLDVRLLEFRLQGEGLNLPGVVAEARRPAGAPNAPPGTPVPPAANRWTLWIVIGLAGALLLAFLAVIALVALSRMRGKNGNAD